MADVYDEIAASLPSFEQEDEEALLVSLREAGRTDPLRGEPMAVAVRPGAEPELVEPAEWRHGLYADARTGLPVNCPVTPLGKQGKVFYFLNTLGEVHDLQDSASGKGPLDALFAGRPLFLEWAWPRRSWNQKERAWSVKGWEADEARRDLFAACAYKGTFELEDRVRGRGAWRDDDGSLIYHAGDAVYIDGKWRPPGEHGRFIYPGRPKIGRPDRRYIEAGEGSPGDLVLQGLMTWNWERGEVDARLALGWLMTALVGGGLEQRPVIYVPGPEGSGKSTLQKLLRLLMNGALLATSNTTQAGIYQKVRQDSVAVMVDEMEAKEDTRTTDKILELARVAYSGDKMQRGGKDGVGQEFSVFSSFFFSSIAMPAIDAQDASRMAVLVLRAREKAKAGAGGNGLDVLRELGLRDGPTVALIGRQLLRRMFRWFELDPKASRQRWEVLRDAFRGALIGAGHEDRSADTFGALAAGCHVALADDYPDKADLARWAEWLRADKLEETANREGTWRRCLMHMLKVQPDVLKTTESKSVGEILERWRTNPELSIDKLIEWLSRCGLSMSWAAGDPQVWDTARLFVPANHPALHALFAGTPWAGRPAAPGPWSGVLRQMPRALWENGKCDRGLDRKAAGLFVKVAAVLEA